MCKVLASRFFVFVVWFAASSLVRASRVATAPTAFGSSIHRYTGRNDLKHKRKSRGWSYFSSSQAPSASSRSPEPPASRKLTLPPFNEYIRDLLIRHSLSVTFSPEIEAVALAAIQGDETLVAPDASPLVDLADRPYITIDNDDSMDLDQAMFIAPWYGPPPHRGSGNRDTIGGIRESKIGVSKDYRPQHYLISYALTDGRHYVPPSSPLFKTALERGGVSFYLPGLCVPMLPRSLSEGAMSLNENEIRRALVFEMVVDAETGEVQYTKPLWAKVKSIWKGSYRLVQEYYDEEDSDNIGEREKRSPICGTAFEETVVLLRKIGQLRRRLMRRRNIVELHRSELGIAYDPKTGSLVKKNPARYKSELFNEQISLMCNMEGARLLDALDVVEDLIGTRNDVNPIYRYQDAPRQDQIDDLVSLIDKLIELHSLDGEFFRWVPRESEGTDFGGEHLGDYLKRLHHRINGGTTGNAHLEADVLRAIDRQAVMTNVGAHFGGEVRQHYSLRVDAYARFSSPMRELVGCFTHKQLWDGIYAARLGIDTSIGDPELRERIIDAAESAKRTQRRLSAAVHLYLMDAFFAADLKQQEQERPRRPGAIIGIDSTAQSKKRRSRTIYVKIDELEVKVSVDDLKQVYGVRYLPTDTIGEYGLCVELVPQNQEGHAPTFFVGQSVDLSVFDRNTFWVFKIEPRTGVSSE